MGESWQYELVSDAEGRMPVLQWRGTTDLAVEDLAAGPSKDDRSALDDAAEFLMEELAAGPKPMTVVERDAQARGHSMRTVDRAKRRLNIASKRTAKGWIWALPKS
jgi:hypothetical protein